MKRILMMISGKDLGGPKQSFITYAKMIINLGYKITLVIKKNSDLAKNLTPYQVIELKNYYRIDKWPFRPNAIKKMQQIFCDISPDISIFHKPIDLFFFKKANPQSLSILVAHGFYKAKELHYASFSNFIIAVSYSVQKYLSERLKNKIFLLHNAVQTFTKQPLVKQYSDKNLIIGTMCIFRRKKNIPMLIKACHLLKKRGINFKLLIAGKGRQKLTIMLYILALNMQKHTSLLPWVINKKKFFDMIDVFVVTSNTESFNISIIEAMSYGVPVISTKCMGPAEIIYHNNSGILIEKNDYVELANQIENLFKSNNYRKNIIKSAYKELCSRFTVDIIQKKLQAILNDIERHSIAK